MSKTLAERDGLGRTVPDLVHTLERVRSWLEEEEDANPLYDAFGQCANGDEEYGLGITGDGDDQMMWPRFLHLAATTNDTIYWQPIHPALAMYRAVVDALIGDFGASRHARHEFHYFSESVWHPRGIDEMMCDRCDLTEEEYQAQQERSTPPNRRPRTQAEYDLLLEELYQSGVLYPMDRPLYVILGMNPVLDVRLLHTPDDLARHAEALVTTGRVLV